MDADKNCASCRFSEMRQMPPPQLLKARFCLWGPPQIFLMPAPGGFGIVSGHPQVNDAETCYRHEKGNSSTPAEKAPSLTLIK
jgi:hypothetical protein